jgi:hypothetical protein
MQAVLAGKDLQRFRTLAAQYATQLKNAPGIADTKPKDPPELARGE